MSFILNALRKSEQERQSLQPETVTDRILIHQPQQSRSRTAKFFAFLIIGNLLIIACVIWFVRNNSTPTPDLTAKTISKSLSGQETRVKPKPIAETAQRKIPSQKTKPRTPSIAEWVETQKPEPSSLATKPVITKKPVADTIKQPVIANKPEELPGPTTPAIAAAAAVKIKLDSPETIPLKTVSVQKDIPFLSDLPFEFRQTIPKFNINVFVYSQHPEERFVMIDMIKYKPGQQIKDAMVLKEIRPDSLVIVYENRAFQIERP